MLQLMLIRVCTMCVYVFAIYELFVIKWFGSRVRNVTVPRKLLMVSIVIWCFALVFSDRQLEGVLPVPPSTFIKAVAKRE